MGKAIVSCLEYLFIFLLIIAFNTPYTYFVFIKRGVDLMLFIILIGLILSKIEKIKVDFLVLIIIFGALLPSLNVAEGQIFRYIRLYILFLPLLIIYLTALFKDERCRIYSLFFKYSNIVVVVAILSLIFWILGSMLEIIPYTTVIPNSWGEDRFIPTYYGVYFETQGAMVNAEQDTAVVRNSGIFNEAPMYNMILCVALAIETFIRPKLSKMRIFILTVTIFSTISTTGIIFMLMLLTGKLFIVMSAKRRFVLLLCFPIVMLFSFFLISSLLDNKKETGKSYDARGVDIIRCIEVGLENPILGVELFHHGNEDGGTKANGYGFSNSLFTIFAHGGFYMWILYLLPLFIMPIFCYKKDKDIRMLGIMLCYFFLFAFTISLYTYLTIFFMAIGLSYWNVVFYMRKAPKKHAISYSNITDKTLQKNM